MRDYPHVNIVKVFDTYVVQDELWVVMEYMDGSALTDIVTRTRSPSNLPLPLYLFSTAHCVVSG